MMRKAVLVLMLFSVAFTSYAAKVQQFADNQNIEVQLSKLNYNRLFVANDVINKAHFSKDALSIEYEVDGSVFIDLLIAEPFTVFFSTEHGHHFSVTVNPIDELGQTVELIPNTPSVKAQKFEKKTAYEETVTKLIQAMMNNQIPAGYGVKSAFSMYKSFNQDLSLKVGKQYMGDAYVGEVVTIYNRSKVPVKLDEAWFKTKDTRAIALSQPIVAPKNSATLYVVKERAHA